VAGFSNEQQALFITDGVLHSFSIGERTDTKEFQDLEQKILSFAKDFGMDE
jgi:hypothetical protein